MKQKQKSSKTPRIEITTTKKEHRLAVVRTQTPYWVMLIIPLTFFILIRYWPMNGLAIAFQNYRLGDSFISLNSKWVGLKWFKQLLRNPNFPRLVRNTLALNILSICISFPISIAFALLLNEVRVRWFRNLSANISLLPYFISTVVIVAIMYNVFSVDDGLVNMVIQKLGGSKINFLGSNKWFRPLYIGSAIWQNTGFNAVVFTAAISGIEPTLYEAAALDGSNRLKNIFYVTIPCIMPTIIIMLLLRIGNIMSIGYEKIILMYTPSTYEVSDVLSTYAYRVGLGDQKYSLSAAISLMNSVCNVILLVSANKITKKLSETSLW